MATLQYRRLGVTEEGNVVIARMVDKTLLDETTIQAFGNELFSFTERPKPKVVLSFHGVTFISSLVLAKLIDMDDKIKGAKGQWRLCEVIPEIYEVFEITRLHKRLTIVETREEALLQLQ